MANKDGKKKTSGVRNDGRKNGKKFNKKRFNLDAKGRPLTGRGKPTGRSIKGKKACAYYCDCSTCKRNDVIDLTRVAA